MFRRLVAGLGLAALLAAAAPAAAEPPLWRVKGTDGREVVLFGSVHLLDADARWFGPDLAAALKGAQRVWFEIPFDAASQQAAQGAALAKGRLPQGESLSALLSPEGRTRLAAVEAELKLPAVSIDRLQPWLADALISVSYFLKAGARADLGVEQAIDHAAPPTAQRGALETVDDQIAALAAGSRADQVASLEQTLKDVHDDPDAFARLEGAWERGDTQGLVREELEPLRRDSPSVYARLITDRNRRWLGELEQLLRTGPPGRTLVVVGAGHLVGAGGVPALLRRDGFAVSGP
ncbi:MAG: TraB/GumN family protein [Caulobacteraceae bacterium]|nr:TraB/GumN family protein [Caulobacter sp.]